MLGMCVSWRGTPPSVILEAVATAAYPTPVYSAEFGFSPATKTRSRWIGRSIGRDIIQTDVLLVYSRAPGCVCVWSWANARRVDFQVLLKMEREAKKQPGGASIVLQDVVWKDNMAIRLLLHTIARDSQLPDVSEEVAYLTRALLARLPDEKCPEDVHQHCRDRQRAKRHKMLRLSSIQDAQLGSGVLTSRSVNEPAVSLGASCARFCRSDFGAR